MTQEQGPCNSCLKLSFVSQNPQQMKFVQLPRGCKFSDYVVLAEHCKDIFSMFRSGTPFNKKISQHGPFRSFG